jgi:hypothetical protein
MSPKDIYATNLIYFLCNTHDILDPCSSKPVVIKENTYNSKPNDIIIKKLDLLRVNLQIS